MKLFLTKKANKHFVKLDQKTKKRILLKLKLIEDNPFLGKKLSGQLAGLYSARVWPYRVIYKVDYKDQEVWVVSILHRQGSYR